jgi:hypothetical protein
MIVKSDVQYTGEHGETRPSCFSQLIVLPTFFLDLQEAWNKENFVTPPFVPACIGCQHNSYGILATDSNPALLPPDPSFYN